MKRDNERALIRKIQHESDRESANKLIGIYYLEIYSFIFKQVGDKELAMDLTQDIFVSVLQSISGYDAHKASFRTWLYRIASNKTVDYFRSARYRLQQMCISIESVIIPQDATLEDAYQDSQLLTAILTEVSNLPFVAQQIVRLKVYTEQSFREIAAELSLPESTVKTKYYSAIKSIREKVIKE